MSISEYITTAITSFGYWGIAFLMLLENVIPPIPSELIMPLAGFAAARGEMNLVSAIASGTFGSVLGALVWYYVGRWLGLTRICNLADRHGKWLGISSEEVMSVQQWFSRRGGYWAVGLGRLIPGIRTYISVPPGIANMPMVGFLFYSTVGSLGWITLLTLAGFWLGASYEKVGAFLGPVGTVVIVLLVVLSVGWVIYQRRKKSKKP